MSLSIAWRLVQFRQRRTNYRLEFYGSSFQVLPYLISPCAHIRTGKISQALQATLPIKLHAVSTILGICHGASFSLPLSDSTSISTRSSGLDAIPPPVRSLESISDSLSSAMGEQDLQRNMTLFRTVGVGGGRGSRWEGRSSSAM